MSAKNTQQASAQVAANSPGVRQQAQPLNLSQIDIRTQAAKAMKNMLSTIKELHKENAKLKEELAELRKKS